MATKKKPGSSSDIEFTVFSKCGGALTKRIELLKDGSLVRDGSECKMSVGWGYRTQIPDLHAFAAKLMQLRSYQAIALGVLRDGLPDKVKVITKEKLNGQANTIARTQDYIVYRENHPALVLLDFDRDGMPRAVAERAKDFWQALIEVLPALRNAKSLIRPSTSSGLSRSDTGKRFPDSGGWHSYVVARDGTDAERFLATLHDRCWLNGLGWIKLGAAGQKLERSIIDRMVAAPERLVFEAAPVLVKPIEQDEESRRPIVHEGEVLDTLAVCPPLTVKEQKAVEKLKAAAKVRIEPEAQRVRAAYIEKNALVLAARMGTSIEAAREQISSRCRGVLLPGDVLAFNDRKLKDCTTVADVLADPKRFEGCALADPIEGVSYGSSTAVVMLRRSDGQPWIKSFAHGGTSYTLDSGIDVGVKLENFYAYMPMHNFIFAPTREMWPAESVNARIPPVVIGTDSNGKEITIKASTWIDKNQPVEQITWTPGEPMIIPNRTISKGGWRERKGVSCYNLYYAPTIKLGDASKAKHWVRLVRKVYPTDADHIIKWFAHRRQRPAEKINHALVMGSHAQGIGKDTILEGPKRAVGPWNFNELAPKNIFDPFNPWLRGVIVRVSEAKDMGDVSRYELYEKMKTLLVTPPDVSPCNEKHIKQHYVLNCMAFVLTTNHLTDGIYLPAEDRRHYVAWSECKPTDFTLEFWNGMWKWYDEGGAEHVAAYLDTLDISDFDPKAPPPKTPAFWSIVNANRTTEEAELQDVLDKLGNPDAVTLAEINLKASVDLGEWLTDRKNRKAFNHRLEKCGYLAVNNRVAEDGLWRINERRQMIYAKSTLALGEKVKAAENLKTREEKIAAEKRAALEKAEKEKRTALEKAEKNKRIKIPGMKSPKEDFPQRKYPKGVRF
jgi:hypothetical protein